jgi:hypothetical protein
VLVSVRLAAQCRCVPVNSNVRRHGKASQALVARFRLPFPAPVG